MQLLHGRAVRHVVTYEARNPKHQSLDYWKQLFEYIDDYCDVLIGEAAGKSK